MRPIIFALTVGLLMLALGACGDSSDKAATQTPEEKAQATVCAARADIGTQVDTLKGLTAATVTKDAVTQSVDAIKKDLGDMSSAQEDLSSDRRSEVEAATTEFKSSVKEVSSQLLKSVSASDAKAALVTALQKLEASYQTAFEPLNCD